MLFQTIKTSDMSSCNNSDSAATATSNCTTTTATNGRKWPQQHTTTAIPMTPGTELSMNFLNLSFFSKGNGSSNGGLSHSASCASIVESSGAGDDDNDDEHYLHWRHSRVDDCDARVRRAREAFEQEFRKRILTTCHARRNCTSVCTPLPHTHNQRYSDTFFPQQQETSLLSRKPTPDLSNIDAPSSQQIYIPAASTLSQRAIEPSRSYISSPGMDQQQQQQQHDTAKKTKSTPAIQYRACKETVIKTILDNYSTKRNAQCHHHGGGSTVFTAAATIRGSSNKLNKKQKMSNRLRLHISTKTSPTIVNASAVVADRLSSSASAYMLTKQQHSGVDAKNVYIEEEFAKTPRQCAPGTPPPPQSIRLASPTTASAAMSVATAAATAAAVTVSVASPIAHCFSFESDEATKLGRYFTAAAAAATGIPTASSPTLPLIGR